jgi:hypothetical protein
VRFGVPGVCFRAFQALAKPHAKPGRITPLSTLYTRTGLFNELIVEVKCLQQSVQKIALSNQLVDALEAGHCPSIRDKHPVHPCYAAPEDSESKNAIFMAPLCCPWTIAEAPCRTEVELRHAIRCVLTTLEQLHKLHISYTATFGGRI